MTRRRVAAGMAVADAPGVLVVASAAGFPDSGPIRRVAMNPRPRRVPIVATTGVQAGASCACWISDPASAPIAAPTDHRAWKADMTGRA